MTDMLNDGNIKLTFVEEIADISAPTETELAQGFDLECLVTADGFQPTVNEDVVSVAKLCETSNSESPGRATHQVTLTMVRQEEEDQDVGWTNLKRNQTGFLAVRFGVEHSLPWEADDKAVVYPVRCGTRRLLPPEANGATLFEVQMYVTAEPNLDAVVVAGS